VQSSPDRDEAAGKLAADVPRVQSSPDRDEAASKL
jgi:hypothetical protein